MVVVNTAWTAEDNIKRIQRDDPDDLRSALFVSAEDTGDTFFVTGMNGWRGDALLCSEDGKGNLDEVGQFAGPHLFDLFEAGLVAFLYRKPF